MRKTMTPAEIQAALNELDSYPRFARYTDLVADRVQLTDSFRRQNIKKADVSCVKWRHDLNLGGVVGCTVEFTSREARKRFDEDMVFIRKQRS